MLSWLRVLIVMISIGIVVVSGLWMRGYEFDG